MPVSRHAGFTLLEMLIAVSLVILLLLSASSLFLIFLVSNTKVSGTKLVKQEGTYAIGQMEFLLRNAIELETNSFDQECEEDMTEITLKSIDGQLTTFSAEEDEEVTKIASNSGIFLTSADVDVSAGPEFDCTQGGDETQPQVTTTFTLRKGVPGVDQQRDIIEEVFTSTTTIRSF